ncbi:O-antigen polysaccharide polymerase Wzy [uncultured Collinsella sp.]|uniref:O-antigen polysaccharide polymerase Wzy n=1 Tax=uncultured Collinsella sp. TaxID=165190 RepID=UPI002672F574|nr:O-antigen polysaccharide polymerase Wzy [uncultured Collinsella sp.]
MRAVDKVKSTVLNASASSVGTMLTLIAFSLIMLVVGAPTNDYQVCNQLVIIAAICSYAGMLYHAFKLTDSISFYLLVLLVSFPFYFGKQLLVAFGLKPARIYISSAALTVSSTWESSFFILLSLSILQLGYCLFAKRRSPDLRAQAEQARCSKSYYALRKASVFLIIVLAIPTLFYLFENIQLTNSVGYGARVSDAAYRRSGIANAFGILATIMPYALLAAFLTREKGEKWQILATCLYSGLYMMQGSRTDVFVLALAFAYVWFLCYSNKRAVESLLQMAAALALLAALFSFGSFARAGFSDTGTVSNADDSNILVEAVGEAASTYSVTAKVIEMVPEKIKTVDGETYLAGLLYVLPNGLTGNAYLQSKSVDEVFSPYLTYYGGVGSSFIAEAYFNFGPYSVVLFFLYGVCIAMLQNAVERSYEKGSYGTLFACCASFMLMSFYIRSDVRTFPRYFIWNALPIIIVQQVILPRIKAHKDVRKHPAIDLSDSQLWFGGSR